MTLPGPGADQPRRGCSNRAPEPGDPRSPRRAHPCGDHL